MEGSLAVRNHGQKKLKRTMNKEDVEFLPYFFFLNFNIFDDIFYFPFHPNIENNYFL